VGNNHFSGRCVRVKRQIKEAWGHLSDDEIDLYSAARAQLIKRLEEKYGLLREDAEIQLRRLEDIAHDWRIRAA